MHKGDNRAVEVKIEIEMEFESLKARKPVFKLLVFCHLLSSIIIVLKHGVISCLFSELDINPAVVLLVNKE